MFSFALPLGGFGWSVEAKSVVEATLAPLASMSEAGGFLIPGSLMKVTTVMKTRITAAPTVQPISSRVLPWICAATRPRRALKRKRIQIRIPSTPANTTSAMIMIRKYSSAMSFAFCDGPLSGRKRPARMFEAASKAERSIWTARSASASGLGPLEGGRALGQEGLDALHEVT